MAEITLFFVGAFYALITFVAVWLVARFEPGGADSAEVISSDVDVETPANSPGAKIFKPHTPSAN